jgi:V-type H+-transporting ATPase subunit H
MIDKNDYEIISRFDSNNPAEREKIECIKTLLTILSKISKESTLQYTVMLIDDFLQENKSRAELFHQYGKKYKENIYQTFAGMLYLQDAYIVNQVSRILTKLACWSNDFMPEKELKDYFLWIKEQLDERVIQKLFKKHHLR